MFNLTESTLTIIESAIDNMSDRASTTVKITKNVEFLVSETKENMVQIAEITRNNKKYYVGIPTS